MYSEYCARRNTENPAEGMLKKYAKVVHRDSSCVEALDLRVSSELKPPHGIIDTDAMDSRLSRCSRDATQLPEPYWQDEPASMAIEPVIIQPKSRTRATFIELVGSVAGACTTAAFLPQVYAVYMTGDTAGLSLSMYCIFVSGVFMWIM